MADPKIKYDIEAQATGEAAIEKLTGAVKELGDSIDQDLKREADAAAQALRKVGEQSAAAEVFRAAGLEAERAGAAFKEAKAGLDDLDRKFATAATAAQQFGVAEKAALDAVRAAARELDAAKIALAQIDATYDKAGRGTAEYEAATGALRLTIAKLNADLREKKVSLQDASQAAKAAEREETALVQQHQKASVEVGRLRKAYEDSNRALADAKSKLTAAGVDAGNFAAEQRRLSAETDRANAAVRGLAGSLGGMSEAAKAGKVLSEAFGTLGVRSAADLRAEIAQVRAAMQTVEQSAGLTGAALQQALGAGNGRLKELQRELRSVQGEMTLADRASGLLRTGLAQIAGGNVIANAIGGIANKAQDMGREFLAANLQMEGMRRALNAVYKDASVTAGQIDFLRKTATDAGVSAGSLADSFRSFSASTAAANIPLETTNALFASVTKAGATLGLSGERVSLVLQALGQMAAKGTVSMEELRQQLGESLPGALSLSAKGLGLTEAQLIKLVESGQLAARDLFPALAKSLRDMQGETDGVATSWERLKNALTVASQNTGDAGGMQVLTLAVKTLGAVAAAVVLPLSAFAEVVFGLAKAAGVLLGSLVTLTSPMQALGEIADGASARQAALVDSFKALVFGADSAANSHAAAGAAISQAGRDAGAAAVGVGQVTQAHSASAGAAQANAAAHGAVAIASQVAADASMDASAKWVQLGVRLGEVAVIQEQQAKNAEKLAAATRIEGESIQALATLRGNDLEMLEAASSASQAHAAALEKVASAREVQLGTLRAELAAKQQLIANNAEEQKARAAEIQAIQKKIDALDAETAASRAAAEAAKTDAATKSAAVGAYHDNAEAVGALRMALEQAIIVQEAFESDRRKGIATDQQVDEAKRRVAEAQRLYNDSLNDAVAAEQRKAAAAASSLQLERTGLELAAAKAKAAEARAVAEGNEYAATAARIKQKEIEIATLKLTVKALLAEADAMDMVTNKKIEAAIAEGKWNQELAAQMQLLRQSAEQKRLQAASTSEGLKELERQLKNLKSAGNDARDGANAAAGGFKAMGQAADNAANSAKRLREIYDRHRLDPGDPNKSDIDNLYDRHTPSSSADFDKAVNKSRSEVSGNATLTKEYVDAQIAKQWGEQFIGDADAMELFNAQIKLDAYRTNYGNVVRSQQSLNEQHALLQAVQRLEEKLRARQADGLNKRLTQADDDDTAPEPTTRRSRTTGGGGVQGGMQTGAVAGGTVVNLNYNGVQLGAVNTDASGRQSLQKFMDALTQARSVAR
ncbi:MAG: tape measure protein [Giesbergeria sp.]|nr:tape measure protein [Giesbergeria sp.]